MSIYSNPSSYHSAGTSLSRDKQTPSINDSVNAVGFTVLVQNPAIAQKPTCEQADQVLFKLKNIAQTNSPIDSSLYTIVTWNGRPYRISVHEKKNQLSYTKEDWQKIAGKMQKLWDTSHANRHFSKGTLQLKKKIWAPVFIDKTIESKAHEQKSTQALINEIKNLFTNEIKALNVLPASKKLEQESQKKSRFQDILRNSTNSLFNNTPSVKHKKPMGFPEKPKQVFKKIMEYLYPAKSHVKKQPDISSTNESITPTEELINQSIPEPFSSSNLEQEKNQRNRKGYVQKAIKHFFPKQNQKTENEFDLNSDISSIRKSSEKTPEAENEFDLNSYATSIREGSLTSDDDSMEFHLII